MLKNLLKACDTKGFFASAVQRQIKNAAQAATWLKTPSAPDGRTLLLGGPVGGHHCSHNLKVSSLPPGKADGIVDLQFII